LMHYPVRDALIETLNSQINATQFGDKVESLFDAYPQENVRAMYVPLGSHDTKRIHHKLSGNLEKIKLAFLFQFAYPGAPAIYYGDEVGVDGDKDPDCRRAFPWDKKDWKGDLRHWVQTLIGLRKEFPAMRRGEYIRLLAEEKGYAFARKLGAEKIVVAMNLSENPETLRIPVGDLLRNGQELRSLLNHEKFGVQDGFVEIKLDAWSGVWLK
ncbi:MAG: DUF3459 domain-containing protein, partial [Anaerolineae bacterium]|nr:DUF3459 domain-containing protein [Anaerolineae bacterium]